MKPPSENKSSGFIVRIFRNFRENEPVTKVFVTALLVGLVYLGVQSHQSEKSKIQRLTPEMTRLAAEGKPNAIQWMHLHRVSPYQSYSETVKKLAESGDGFGMWALARHLVNAGNRAEANEWFQKSAAQGYEPAMDYVQTRPEIFQ